MVNSVINLCPKEPKESVPPVLNDYALHDIAN